MSYRKMLAVSVLAILTIAGCSESSNPKEFASLCGNQTLDMGERCDGALFAEGAKACPFGQLGDVSKITCSQTCQVVTEGVCMPSASFVCTEGNARCVSGEPASIETCRSNAWEKSGCGDNQVCENGACKPQSEATCNNNGVLDSGENCDGDFFAAGMDVCPEGFIGKPVCGPGCQVLLDGHCTSETLKPENCGNGALEDGEECDFKTQGDSSEAIFAAGKDVCPAGQTGKPMCDASSCTVKLDSCKGGDSNEQEYCDGNVYTLCIDGECTTEDCAATGKQCNPEKPGCVLVDEYQCQDNILNWKSGGESVQINCSALGALCDESKGDCVSSPFTCDGSTIKLTGKTFSYDCKENAKSEDSKNKIACAEGIGCSDIYCDGEKLMLCDSTGCMLYDDCSLAGAHCSAKAASCVCDSFVSKCIQRDGATYHVMCDESEYVETKCKSDEICSTDGGCEGKSFEPNKCGNGIVEKNNKEVCDFVDGSAIWGILEPTCNYYDKDKVFVSGAPACHKTKCTVDVAGCNEATDADYNQVKSWSISSSSEFDAIKSDKSVSIHNVDNSGFESKFATDGWQLSPWPTDTKANFDAYVQFTAGAVSNNTVRISLNIKRSSKGPKKIQLQYLDGSTVLGTSSEYELTESYKTLNIVYKTSKSLSNFSFKLTGYNGGKGVLTLNKVEVKSVNAI
ncbi:MAG: hypothetical protein J6A01_03190 [Proteobacteria bacterium]|nr:hypothetical protein [Pseudomonadota bacterium]